MNESEWKYILLRQVFNLGRFIQNKNTALLSKFTNIGVSQWTYYLTLKETVNFLMQPTVQSIDWKYVRKILSRKFVNTKQTPFHWLMKNDYIYME